MALGFFLRLILQLTLKLRLKQHTLLRAMTAQTVRKDIHDKAYQLLEMALSQQESRIIMRMLSDSPRQVQLPIHDTFHLQEKPPLSSFPWLSNRSSVVLGQHQWLRQQGRPKSRRSGLVNLRIFSMSVCQLAEKWQGAIATSSNSEQLSSTTTTFRSCAIQHAKLKH